MNEDPHIAAFLAFCATLRPNTWGRVPIGTRDEQAAWDNRRFIKEMMDRNSGWESELREWVQHFTPYSTHPLAPARKRYNLIAWIEEQWHSCVDWHSQKRAPKKKADFRAALPGRDNPNPEPEVDDPRPIQQIIDEAKEEIRKR